MLFSKLLAASGQPILYVGGDGGRIVFTNFSVSQTISPNPGVNFGKAGDLNIVTIGVSGLNITNSAPTITCDTPGYTLLASKVQTATASSGAASIYIFGKVITADVILGDTIDFTASGSYSKGYSTLTVWRNTDSLDAAITTASAASSGVPNAPAITTTTNDTVVLALGYYADWGNEDLDLTTPSGMTSATTDNQTQYGKGAYIALPGAPQTYNPAVFGGGGTSASDAWCAATIALRKSSN